MANKEHVEILRRGVKEWNAWRKENLEVMPDLSRADLSRANLAGADLSRVNLSNAILTVADLSDANLTGSVLVIANLVLANLNRANLTKTYLGLTVFGGVNLAFCRGLQEVNHFERSEISTSTLDLTAEGLGKDNSKQGEIEAFLRGAGVDDHWIEYLNTRIGQPKEFYSCFISYSHKNKPFARRLYDGLQGKGIRCWLDEHQVLPGDDIYDSVDRGIRLWDKVLLCCSEASLTSWWVEDEIGKALEKERRLGQERGERVRAIIPLNLDGFLFKGWKSGMATAIRDRLAADFTGWEKNNATFEDKFKDVVAALRADERAREAPPEPKL